MVVGAVWVVCEVVHVLLYSCRGCPELLRCVLRGALV